MTSDKWRNALGGYFVISTVVIIAISLGMPVEYQIISMSIGGLIANGLGYYLFVTKDYFD